MSRPGLRMDQEMLVLEHQGHLRRLARRFSRIIGPAVEFDDLFQAGQIGLIEAAYRWDPAKANIPVFWAYAYTRVWGAIKDSLRQGVWKRGLQRLRAAGLVELQLITSAIAEDGTPLTGHDVPDPAIDIEDALIRKDRACAIREALAQLKPRERDVFWRINVLGQEHWWVGAHHGVNESRSSQLNRKATNHVHRYLSALGLDV